MSASRAGRREVDPATELKKQLRIRTGTFTRLRKEVDMYQREVTQQQEKITQMQEEGKDEADIRKQLEVLEESRSMIPDAQARLEQAQQSLSDQIEVVESSEQVDSIKEADEWRAACDALGL